MIARFLLVCLGGALGSGARYAISAANPFGTLIVNLVGSFAIGLVMELMTASDFRLFLAVGVLGGFTTYSSFNEETLRLFRSGAPLGAMLNLTGTMIGCLLAGIAGAAVARMFR
jgi:CrcB protein